jgi:hypothetical protein
MSPNCRIFLNIIATYGRSLYALVAMSCCFAGCVQLDVSSAADCDENSKTNFCDVTSAYWWDWGDCVQTLLDGTLQREDGRVDERAIQRLIVSQEWWEVLVTWGTLGVVKPVEFTYWLEAFE